MSTAQLVPKFCVFRPEGRFTPLVALDELPSWLWVRGADQFHPFLQPQMVLASRGMVPRDGEYDVVCRNCYSTIDNLHRSASQSYGSSPPPASIPKDANLSNPRGSYPVMPGFHLPFVDVDLSGVNAYVEDPYVGMCLVECPWPLSSSRISSVFPTSMVSKRSFSPESDDSIGSILDPEAIAFSSSLTLPAPYALPSPTRAQPIDNATLRLSHSNSHVFSVEYTGANQESISTPAQKFHAALEQLKETIGVSRDLASPELEQPKDTIGVSHNLASPEREQLKDTIGAGRDLASPVLESEPVMTRYLVGKEGSRRPWKDDRHGRGGGVRRPKVKRLGSLKRLSSLKLTSPKQSRQVNAATKRQERREKLEAQINHGRGDRRRYAHKPWRTQMANR